IAFTRTPIINNQVNVDNAEIYVQNVQTGDLTRLTFNTDAEEASAWSPDGTRIAYMCRIGDPAGPNSQTKTFEICVMNLGTNQVQRLTNNAVFDGSPTWSPDGQMIVFERGQKLWIMNADGTGQALLTSFPGFYFFPKWGMVRTNCEK